MTRTHTNTATPLLRGSQYAATHQASVDAVLGANMRRVHSRGGSFYNRDFWPLRVLVTRLCAFLSQTHRTPSYSEFSSMVHESNQQDVSDPHIVIASTPERLPLPVALALIGGAYHEAWHTLYSCRTDLNAHQLWAEMSPVWNKITDPKGWSRLAKPILDWSNIVEDIRIERLGCRQFPGAEPKMQDLQGFILDQEESARTEAINKGVPEDSLNSTFAVVSATFRDVGLGYNTERQRRALSAYRERNAEAVKFVLNGPLSDLLRETITLTRDDETTNLRIALEIMAAIYEEAQSQSQKDQDKSDSGESDNAPQQCSNCGAPGSKMKARPLSDGKGGIVKGKGVLICTVCGFEQDVDFSDSSEGKGESGNPVEYEDTPHERPDEDSSGDSDEDSSDESGAGSDDDSEGDEKDDGNGSSGDSDEESDEKGSGSGDGSGEENDGSSDASEGSGEESGEDSGEDSGEESGEESSEGSGSDEVTDGNDPSKGKPSESKDTGAGGHQGDTEPAEEWNLTAQDFLNDAESGNNGLIDNNEALQGAFGEESEKEDACCKLGERPYRPFDRSKDSAAFVSPTRSGKANDGTRAQVILNSVKSQCSYLRARLRTMVRSMEQTNIEHGTRRGKGLSERRFVDSRAALMSGRVPNRAYYDEDIQIDTSLAAVVVMDESSSMLGKRLQIATQVFLAIVEPLDALGCATMAIGFRDGAAGYSYGPQNPEDYDGRNYHRYHGVHIDIFKAFNERFQSVKWRFANTRAVGGTPMADGVQFGLETLSERTEAHRILFVVTDGQPNGGHSEVIHHQIRVARESGILVVGVGIEAGARYVTQVFPDSVYTPTVAELPRELVGKLNELMDFRGLRRGRRLKATG